MKTKTLLTRISAAALFAAAAMLPAALTSCSSEAEPAPVKEDPIPEGMARINFAFSAPQLGASTRGATDVSEAEGSLSSLWIYFFTGTVDDDNAPKYAYNIPIAATGTTSDGTFNTNATIHSINKVEATAKTIISGMNVLPDTYRVYVLANMPTDCSGLAPENYATLKESDITGASFTTSTGIIATPSGDNLSAKLPMAANCTEITGVENNSGNITITSGSVTLTAPLTILCSKVRYTIFFDKGTSNSKGFSWPYQSCALADSDPLELTNANTATKAYSNPTKTAAENATALTITEMAYPSSNDLNTFWFVDDAQSTAYKTLSAYDSDSAVDGKHVYQGLAYINEDPSEAKTLKTYLKLTTKLGVAGTTGTAETKTFSIYLPKADDTSNLQKGNYYDIVGKIKGSGEMDIQVSILDWNPYTIDSWEF
ncbi:MAG: hypothetical protein K2G90_09980 [Muribaculaceae bacterium]|nr:hypothetical protein [Muribaculaceae bacterium]